MCGRAVEHSRHCPDEALAKDDSNWALAMVHSRGGIFHSFSDRFKIT